ncbi:cytochrome P450 family protein [Heterostelium album PN500]|uniref:Cytochrome P450 family protein n=1 Tax=Heterostelium pallidum (strain ATCC 26659 / Pp 5 / PN500) TaxID=670386 RepID=D3BC35_HETP5|nr:cytochrome P450 family protein [Heterostelium album PN500]EFA81218.1 cytochrome P450 family protein [Heterostelium album PN500]|eukprot:XP_020433336.1 cytochrome P450 family protein [Heterostelium album PN500]
MNIFIFFIILFTFYVITSYISKLRKFSEKNDPKGPSVIPVLGNLHQMGKLPHRTFLEMTKTYGDVFRVWMGDYYTVVVSDPVIAKLILVTHHDNFLNRVQNPTFSLTSNHYQNLAASRDERWHHNRKLVANSLSKSKLRSTVPVMEKQAELLTITMSQLQKSGRPFSPMKYCKKYALNIIFSIVFADEIPYEEGVEEGRFGMLLHPLDTVFKTLGAGSLVDYITIIQPLFYAYKRFTGTEMDPIFNFVSKLYDEHVATLDPNNPRDVLDVLIIDSEGKDRVGVIAVTIDFMLGGTDTSATTIEWFLLFMANNPDIQEKVGKELKEVGGVNGKFTLANKPNTPYLNAAIKETLRMRHVGPFGLPRETRESILLNDQVFIPKGSQIIICYYGMCHDEKRWNDPETFRPERFLDGSEEKHNEYFLPFGQGPRNCVGMNLANDEMYIAISNIMSNFIVSSHDGKPIDDTENFGI